MAISATTTWRVRAGGNDANGGGFDVAVSGTLATTLNGSLTSGATTMVVASATGWPASGNYYARIGALGPETFSSGGTGSSEVVLVTGGQGTTSWTVTRGQLGTTAQAFATGVMVDNDLSRCDTAPASGSVGTSTASTTFVDVTATFDLTCVGNIIWIASGAGATVGAYIIQSRTNATTVVLDRASGTYTAGVWKMGGGWLTIQTNITTIVAGNAVYIRAGGSGTWANGAGTVDYTMAARANTPNGSNTAGRIRWVGDNGRPYIKSVTGDALCFYSGSYNSFENLYLIANSTANADYGVLNLSSIASAGYGTAYNVIVDQNGLDVTGILLKGGIAANCEVYSSTANAGTAGTLYGISAENAVALDYAASLTNCNVHDCWGNGVKTWNGTKVIANIIAKNRGNGVVGVAATHPGMSILLLSNHIDANIGHGIVFEDADYLALASVLGNIISNHNQVGKYGIYCNFGSTAANDRVAGLIDNNAFYNNTADALNLTVTSGLRNGHTYLNSIGVDPGYVGQATQDYAIGTALQNDGFPQSAFLQSKSGQTTGVRNYMDMGAVQRTGVTPVATTGTASLDFGVAPGKYEASIVITGQAAIAAGSLLEAWILPATTADHSNDEHILNPPRVIAGTIVAGVGFTIYGFSPDGGAMPTEATGAGRKADALSQDNPPKSYGVWNVAWIWV